MQLILEVHQIGLVYQGAHIPLLNDSERQEIQSLSFSFDPDMMGFKFSEISHDRTGAERKPYENFPSWVTAAYGFNLKDFKLNLETSFYFKNGALLKKNILNFRIGSEWALSSQWKISGGLFTDFSQEAKLKPDAQSAQERYDYYGVSAGISWLTRIFYLDSSTAANSWTSVIFSVKYGRGHYKRMSLGQYVDDPVTYSIEKKNSVSYALLISGEFLY